MLIYNTCKEYPNMFRIRFYREPFNPEHAVCSKKKKRNEKILPSSIMRTRSVLSDLCLCNNFEWFVTLTFSPHKVKYRDNLVMCKSALTSWLNHQRYNHSPNMKYLAVPELHKDGAVHFHLLMSDFNGAMRASGVKNKNGRDIYNISYWNRDYGFSTAVKIDNIEAVSAYIRKYITKDMVLIPGQKRYFCSNNLTRPIRYQNFDVPTTALLNRAPVYEDMDSETFELEKSAILTTAIQCDV